MWKWLYRDPLLVVCFAALFAIPLVAAIAARGLPLDPNPDAAKASDERPGRALGTVPAFSVGSELERRMQAAHALTDPAQMRALLRRALADLLGPRRASVALRQVAAPARDDVADKRDPFLQRRVESLLDAGAPLALDERRSRQANDVAALLILAAAGTSDEFVDAPALAYAILRRARGAGDCVPQLNLAFLISTNDMPRAWPVRDEFEEAERRCPGDPTPTWMLGQFQSLDATTASQAVATFRRLQRASPGSALGWSGEGDVELRRAYFSTVLQIERRPFTARAHFRRALRLYRRAARVNPNPGISAGAARALAGLGEYGDAVREQRRALAGRRTLVPLAARYVEYLERDRRFAEAARSARALSVAPDFVGRRSLVARPAFAIDELDDTEDRADPLSIGVDGLHPVSFHLAGPQGPAFTDGVSDVSFIPQYRSDGVTGYDRWTLSRSVPRDLLLSGDPDGALAALHTCIKDINRELDESRCDSPGYEYLGPLAALAELEAGHPSRALSRLRNGDDLTGGAVDAPVYRERPTATERNIAALRDAQQNMWRFAGKLDRARTAARAWLRRLPGDPQAADRLGEIAYLAKDDAAAARWFTRAVRLTRSSVPAPAAQEALALLKRGTALRRAGRRDEALISLEHADETASRVEVATRATPDNVNADSTRLVATIISYHARVQAGDTLLRARRYADAAESYEAAREREPQIDSRHSPLFARPEALHNNQAIAEAKLGHHNAAVAAARKARVADPESPVFLETEGFALRNAGRAKAAESAYRAAVRADPMAHEAWNDLGIVLARQDRLAGAEQAFRHAVGARSDYALGWFNLGVALARRGPTRWLASQGAFGKAFKVDEGLRDRQRRFVSDDNVYFTELDLSKPLPPRWSVATAHERAPVAAAGLVLIVLLGLRLGRSLLGSRFGGGLASKLIEPLTAVVARLPRVPAYTPAIVAVLATLGFFTVGLLRPGAGGAGEPVIFVLGVAALITIVVRGRLQAARRAQVAVAQRGWTPGIALGAAATAAGTGWAPLPVAESTDPAVHWVGPLSTAVAAFGLLILGAWLSIPSTLELASVALIMTASMLTATKPLDGGFVATGAAGVATGLALVAGGLFVVLGVG